MPPRCTSPHPPLHGTPAKPHAPHVQTMHAMHNSFDIVTSQHLYQFVKRWLNALCRLRQLTHMGPVSGHMSMPAALAPLAPRRLSSSS